MWGVHFIWEVADPQSLVPCFSNDDDKQGGVIFPGKALHTSKRRPLHGLALFTEEAAKQEVLCRFFRTDVLSSQHRTRSMRISPGP